MYNIADKQIQNESDLDHRYYGNNRSVFMWLGGVRVIILDSENRILMLKQHHEGRDVWMVPGGAIEEGENAEEAAIREVMEETGLEASIKGLIWHVEEVSRERGQRFVNFFLAEAEGGNLGLGSDPERTAEDQVMRELRFMSREEIEGLDVLYPDYLKDEFWEFLQRIDTIKNHNVFKVRKSTLK